MKVLIISHNPISTQSNMGKTFLSLFSQFQKEELCQLYIYPVIPNEERCASYYRVTDKDILKCLCRFQKPGAQIHARHISKKQGLYENPGDQSFYKNRKNKSAMRRLMRDVIWKIAPWYNSNLRTWLDQEDPDCIFVAPGVAKFLYDIALQISKKRNIPIVTYICDEYYFAKKPKQWLDALRLKMLQRKMEQLMHKSSHLVVISEELKEAYAAYFGLKTTTIMTGASLAIAEKARVKENPKDICYFGNIRCNRYITLEEIGKALDDLNRQYGTEFCLKIYSAEKDPEILKVFEGVNSVELCGFVTGAEFNHAFQCADLLIHTEAFDEASIDFTKHSVSTKIADCLASGIPMIAYGPESISSMAHLLRHECAIAAISAETLQRTLRLALLDKEVRVQVAEKALTVAMQYHDSENNGKALREILQNVADAAK